MARNVQEEAEEQVQEEDAREVYLRHGKQLVIRDVGADQLVEVRSESGLVELRILLTEQGPVLQMEGARLQLRATEAIEIESRRVAIRGEEVTVEAEGDMKLEAKGETHVVGRPIHLNRDVE
jgi:hypothetical protein